MLIAAYTCSLLGIIILIARFAGVLIQITSAMITCLINVTCVIIEVGLECLASIGLYTFEKACDVADIAHINDRLKYRQEQELINSREYQRQKENERINAEALFQQIKRNYCFADSNLFGEYLLSDNKSELIQRIKESHYRNLNLA